MKYQAFFFLEKKHNLKMSAANYRWRLRVNRDPFQLLYVDESRQA